METSITLMLLILIFALLDRKSLINTVFFNKLNWLAGVSLASGYLVY